MPAHRVERSQFAALVVLLSLCVAACGDSAPEETPDEGSSSGAVCPENSALTYDNFGKAFMQRYCTRCHSSALTGSERQGAPSDHDFDDLSGIQAMADHIDEHAAAGPNGVNAAMPPSGATPTQDERMDLGTWLACDAPP